MRWAAAPFDPAGLIRLPHRTLALAALLLSGAAAGSFRPVEDRRYVYDTDETRTADGIARHFHARRSVVFHRTAQGFEAVVTLEAIDHDSADSAGAMFATASGALLRMPLRFQIDPAGRVTGVADADAAIAKIVTAILGIGAAKRDHRPRDGHAQALAAPLSAASPEQKAAMLLSILRPIVLPQDADRPPGRRAVTLPSRPPLPVGARLSGSETVTRAAAGPVTVAVEASGTVSASLPRDVPGTKPSAPGAAPAVVLRSTRTIDATSGLLHDSHETSETRIVGDDGPRIALVETVIRVRLAPL